MRYDEIKNLVQREISKYGAMGHELFYAESDDMTIELKNGKVDSLIKALDKSVSLRLLNDGKLGFSYCTKFSEDGIRKMVESAYQTSRETKVDDCNILAQKEYDKLPEINDFDARIDEIPFDEKVSALTMLEKAAYGHDSRVKSARKLEYKQSKHDIRIFNSEGIDCRHNKTVFSFSAMVAAEENNESEISWESDFSNFFYKLDPASVGKIAAKQACDRLGARVIKSGKMPVILDRLISSELLGVLSSSFYADYILKKKSALIGKIGTKILSDNINIVDDPLYAGGIASFPFDAEGSASAKTVVVENGVLRSYLSDIYTSKKMGIPRTANSVKSSLFAPPSIGNTNFYITCGEKSAGDLIKEMNRGLLITDAMGLHTANPISGEFSIGIAGFYVEDGQIEYPVRGLVYTGNIFEVLSAVAGAANDLKFYSKTAAPSLLIERADIAGE